MRIEQPLRTRAAYVVRIPPNAAPQFWQIWDEYEKDPESVALLSALLGLVGVVTQGLSEDYRELADVVMCATDTSNIMCPPVTLYVPDNDQPDEQQSVPEVAPNRLEPYVPEQQAEPQTGQVTMQQTRGQVRTNMPATQPQQNPSQAEVRPQHIAGSHTEQKLGHMHTESTPPGETNTHPTGVRQMPGMRPVG